MEVTHVKCCYSVIQGIARVTMQNLEGLGMFLKKWSNAVFIGRVGDAYIFLYIHSVAVTKN